MLSSFLITQRLVYGDLLLDAIFPFFLPAAERKHFRVGLNTDAQSFGEWFLLVTGMSVAVFLILCAFVLALVSVLHIPLPDGICDRLKLQLLEFLLRISNEYLGDLVELLFGPVGRNYLTRFLVALPYIFQSRPPKWCTVRQETIAGVRCRVYLPSKEMKKSTAALVFVHGGGWCIMRPNYYDGAMYSLMARIGMTIISIDYQLSPEVQYPVAVEECEAVVKALHAEKHAEFGFDPERIAVMGDSAGGNLTAVLAQRLRAENLNIIKRQILIYPVIHGFDFQSPSYQSYYRHYNGTSLLNPYSMARFYLLYLGLPATRENLRKITENRHLSRAMRNSPAVAEMLNHNQLPQEFLQKEDYEPKEAPEGDKELSERFEKLLEDSNLSPLVAKELAGLPPAMVLTCGFDVLRDEGILYVRKLRKHGVATKWSHYPAAFHGVLNMPVSSQRKQMLDDIAAYLRQNL
uniref:Arylacetamide deacetylase n=1 Tax=Steinernema glaseri TaxID=37863 RepID=A0A1I7Y373_9BILA